MIIIATCVIIRLNKFQIILSIWIDMITYLTCFVGNKVNNNISVIFSTCSSHSPNESFLWVFVNTTFILLVNIAAKTRKNYWDMTIRNWLEESYLNLLVALIMTSVNMNSWIWCDLSRQISAMFYQETYWESRLKNGHFSLVTA